MEAVTELGGALVEDAIEPAFLRELASLTTKLSFQRMAAEEGRARQGGDYWVTTEPFDELPLVKQLGDDLAGRIRSLQVGASSWIPNEVYVQRYRVGDLGRCRRGRIHALQEPGRRSPALVDDDTGEPRPAKGTGIRRGRRRPPATHRPRPVSGRAHLRHVPDGQPERTARYAH
jgi:hypothetical protein